MHWLCVITCHLRTMFSVILCSTGYFMSHWLFYVTRVCAYVVMITPIIISEALIFQIATTRFRDAPKETNEITCSCSDNHLSYYSPRTVIFHTVIQ